MSAIPEALPFTGDREADELIAQDPLALLIGFVLDQQVTVQKAFSGPLELRRRLGHLDPARIAGTSPDELERVFREKPAIHRYPGTMAARVQALCAYVTEIHGGRAQAVWTAAETGADLRSRLGRLPGIGDMKVASLLVVLHRRYGVSPDGIEAELPSHPTLGDVATAEDLAAYQAAKREQKQRRRAEADAGGR
jgi:uncharacterized HhH-GPD family protein